MSNNIPILIFQTSPDGCRLVDRVLTIAGHTPKKDFLVSSKQEELGEHLVEGQDQFFITGTVGVSLNETISMVQSFRKKNQKLLVASFLPRQAEGPFDVTIIKRANGNKFDGLIRAVGEFSEGKLRK